MGWYEDFAKKGYAKISAVDMKPLDEIRDFISIETRKCFNITSDEKNPEIFLDNFHKNAISDADLNAGKLRLIECCNKKEDIGNLLYNAFSSYIDQLLGPDLLVQKSTNIILFPPNYQHYSEPHRDAPPNSPFELVFWVPLTKCYGTKTLYILDIHQSKKAFSLLVNEGSYEKFENFCRQEGEHLEAKFGEACIFWPGLAHGSGMNTENETRWTLNMRYKNAYSPNAPKDALQFFNILKLSPVTRFGIELQKEIFSL